MYRAFGACQIAFRQLQSAILDAPLQGQMVRGNGRGRLTGIHVPEGRQGRNVFQGEREIRVQACQQLIDLTIEQGGRGK